MDWPYVLQAEVHVPGTRGGNAQTSTLFPFQLVMDRGVLSINLYLDEIKLGYFFSVMDGFE